MGKLKETQMIITEEFRADSPETRSETLQSIIDDYLFIALQV